MIKRLPGALILLVLLLATAGCGSSSSTGPLLNTAQTSENTQGRMIVHFLDVGQGDSIFVQLPNGHNMLVDAGPREAGTDVVNYLKKAGVKKIDYLVATHPHEDHIGGMTAIIRRFDIDRVYMPRVTYTTKVYEDLLKGIQAEGLKINAASDGVEIINSGGLRAEMIAPNSAAYEEINNYSTVIKLSFGKTGFLLTGDAESQSEREMLADGYSLEADVLKVGHHGSYSSTSPAFLNAVRPKYSVISCGAGNDYGFPHAATLQKLRGIQLFRTDLDGDVVFETDGEGLQVSTERR
ncbi:ComEC/Rec2 family competence protein [Pelotomaculum propionicicum]|uniref:ComEC/Rec2 family competence protein n=1 Tax=Pelotomaculum propionicicum TaxID=258475 RepID=UPI003B7C6A95